MFVVEDLHPNSSVEYLILRSIYSSTPSGAPWSLEKTEAFIRDLPVFPAPKELFTMPELNWTPSPYCDVFENTIFLTMIKKYLDGTGDAFAVLKKIKGREEERLEIESRKLHPKYWKKLFYGGAAIDIMLTGIGVASNNYLLCGVGLAFPSSVCIAKVMTYINDRHDMKENAKLLAAIKEPDEEWIVALKIATPKISKMLENYVR